MVPSLPLICSLHATRKVAERLSELGFKVAETDYGGYSVVDKHGYQQWDVDRRSCGGMHP